MRLIVLFTILVFSNFYLTNNAGLEKVLTSVNFF